MAARQIVSFVLPGEPRSGEAFEAEFIHFASNL
jgi:hypothetical protein